MPKTLGGAILDGMVGGLMRTVYVFLAVGIVVGLAIAGSGSV